MVLRVDDPRFEGSRTWISKVVMAMKHYFPPGEKAKVHAAHPRHSFVLPGVRALVHNWPQRLVIGLVIGTACITGHSVSSLVEKQAVATSIRNLRRQDFRCF